jgi:molybdopterin synthase catalytic subunit
MDINTIMAAIKANPNYDKAGMVLYHNGIVRSTSRDGRPVTGLRVAVDRQTLEKVVQAHRQRPGIVDIQVEIAADRNLQVGDDVMLLAVAGDIRENVIDTLRDTLNAIKTTVTEKTEFFT